MMTARPHTTSATVPSLHRTATLRLAVVLALIGLGGCETGNITGDWMCPAQPGQPCASIAEADAMGGHSAIRAGAVVPVTNGGSAAATSAPTIGIRRDGYRVRTPETVARVWVYPFVDAADVYHEGGYIHLVLAPAAWRVDDAHLFPPEPINMEPTRLHGAARLPFALDPPTEPVPESVSEPASGPESASGSESASRPVPAFGSESAPGSVSDDPPDGSSNDGSSNDGWPDDDGYAPGPEDK